MLRLPSNIFNAPNALSSYRLAMAPVLAFLALTDERTIFVVFLCLSFASDIVDGIIARAWNLRTSFGSRLDSLADEMTYIAALIGALQFEYQALRPHAYLLYAYLVFLAVSTLVPLIKFRKIPGYHLYSFKINALFQALFFFTLFVFDFYSLLYYPVFIFGILACIESIALSVLLDKPISDAKGIFWVLSKEVRNDS